MRRLEAIGNLGRDAEYKALASGTEVLNFSIGTKGKKKDSETVWVRCALFGKRAASLASHLTKGTRVFVRGSMELRAWSSNGKSGTDVELTVDELELLGGGEKQEARRAPAQQEDADDPFA